MKATQMIKITLMLPLVAVLMFSCRKDEPLDPPIVDPSDTTQDSPVYQKLNITDIFLEDTSCFSFPEDSSGSSTGVVYSGPIQYKTPCFNPNNSNEFIYYYKNDQTGEYQLIKYNLQTQQKTIIKNGFSSITPPQWGANDQIVFNPSYNISIMNSNGSGVTQISNATANLYPAWDATGENIYWQHSPVLGHPYFVVKKKLQTGELDTVMYSNGANHGYARYLDISISNVLICETGINNRGFIGYTDLNPINIQGLVDIGSNQMQSLTDICWHPNGEDFYFTVVGGYGSGLFKMNINNLSEATRVVSFCESKYYTNISCSSDGNYLIGERRNAYIDESDGKKYRNSFIYTINLNTLEEIKIDLE